MSDDDVFDGGEGSGKGILIFFGILFFPAVIFAMLSRFFLLRVWKQKPIMAVIISATISAIALIFGAIVNTIENTVYVFTHITDFVNNWTLLIPLVIVVNVVLGSILGLIYIFADLRRMKENPQNFKLEGNWMYGFKFNRTPWEALKRLKTIKGLKSGSYSHIEKAPLGLDEENSDSVVYRYNSEAQKQTLISGAAGSGKTITMLSLILNDIQNGLPVVVVDFKRSPELATKISTWSKENGREFYHFVNGDPKRYDVPNSKGQAHYDPLINGGAAKADMVLGMREYDTAAEVYKSSMRQLLQVLFAMLKQADRRKTTKIDWNSGGIYQVASAVNGNITELASACEGQPIQEDAEAVDIQSRNRSSNLKHAMDELQGQMRTIIASEYGRWLKTSETGRNIDLYKLTENENEGNVILFSLNADSEKDFSKYLGSLIFSDLNAVSSLRRNNGKKNQVNIYVDEFQAVPPTAVTNLLEKSRESRLGMTLSSQSFEQIIAASDSNGEAYLLGILDTCSNFIVHSGATEDSAIRLAKILGKKMFTAHKQTNTNESFLFSLNFWNKRRSIIQKSEEERWVFHPKGFMSLSSPTKNNGYKSTAVIINKAPDDPRYRNHSGALARTSWMIPNDMVIGEYYIPTLAVGNVDSDNFYENDTLLASDNDEAFEYQDPPVDLMYNNTYDPAGFGNEKDDGDFSWEETDDDFLIPDSEFKTVSENVEQVSENLSNSKPVNKDRRSAIEVSEFDAMFSGVSKPQTLKDVSVDSGELDDESLPDLDQLFK